MAEVTIRIRPFGPYVIEGDVNLVDNAGNPVPLPEGKTIMKLCRCGATLTQPFCDGMHKTICFNRPSP
jgi:CDGSH iron-sulfur domain-containing protein 3